MAVTSRSWPDEILHLTREQEREKHDVPWRDGNERERDDEREQEVYVYVVEEGQKGKREREGKGSEKEVNDEAEEEAEGDRCESSALTSGFDARP